MIKCAEYIREVESMVNINCIEDCIYQESGRCTLDHVIAADKINLEKCTYYIKKKNQRVKLKALRSQ